MLQFSFKISLIISIKRYDIKYKQFIISVSSISINRFAINEFTGSLDINFSMLLLTSKIAVCTFINSIALHLKNKVFI